MPKSKLKYKQMPQLREFPYPYKAALSICSDIDCTNTYEKYIRIQQFMHEEIGIKFSNTFFPFLDNNEFSFFSGREEDKNIIVEHIKNGMIDAIHSYGEIDDCSREHAIKTINELRKNSCKLDIWIDHAQAKSNLCKYRFPGKGDIPGAKEHHFDLTKAYGIKFIWTERLTNIIGQGVRLGLTSILKIFDFKHPLSSFIQAGKTILKIIYDCVGSKKYNYFKNNNLVKLVTLADGQKIYEFIRFNNYFKGPAGGDSFEELYYTISQKVINYLKKVGGYSIVYVHLGRNFNLNGMEGKKTVNALNNLKQEYENGNIYVDTTSRILNYYVNKKYLKWSSEEKNGFCNIIIHLIEDPVVGSYVPELKNLENITFYVNCKAKLFIEGKEINNVRSNPPDETGKMSITIVPL